ADETGEVLAEIAEGIGVATNNVAEYRAAIAGLRRARELDAGEVLLRSDSRLLIEQLAGRFRVKNPTLIKLHHAVREVASGLPPCAPEPAGGGVAPVGEGPAAFTTIVPTMPSDWWN